MSVIFSSLLLAQGYNQIHGPRRKNLVKIIVRRHDHAEVVSSGFMDDALPSLHLLLHCFLDGRKTSGGRMVLISTWPDAWCRCCHNNQNLWIFWWIYQCDTENPWEIHRYLFRSDLDQCAVIIYTKTHHYLLHQISSNDIHGKFTMAYKKSISTAKPQGLATASTIHRWRHSIRRNLDIYFNSTKKLAHVEWTWQFHAKSGAKICRSYFLSDKSKQGAKWKIPSIPFTWTS